MVSTLRNIRVTLGYKIEHTRFALLCSPWCYSPLRTSDARQSYDFVRWPARVPPRWPSSHCDLSSDSKNPRTAPRALRQIIIGLFVWAFRAFRLESFFRRCDAQSLTLIRSSRWPVFFFIHHEALDLLSAHLPRRFLPSPNRAWLSSQ